MSPNCLQCLIKHYSLVLMYSEQELSYRYDEAIKGRLSVPRSRLLLTCNGHFTVLMLLLLLPSRFQSCPTLCDPIDGSPPGSAVPGILQARVLEGLPLPSPTVLMRRRHMIGLKTELGSICHLRGRCKKLRVTRIIKCHSVQ